MNIFKNLFILLLMVTFGCSKNHKNANENFLGKYQTKNEIRLTEATKFYGTGRLIDSLIVSLNLYEHSLNLISISGELLDSIGNYGKGPGELLNPQFFDNYKSNIYLVDSGNNKILHYKIDVSKKEFEYIGEFRIKFSPTDLCVMNKDKLLITSHSPKKFYLFNTEGIELKEYNLPESDVLEDYFIENCSSNRFVLGNISKMRLSFFKFNSNKNEIEKIKSTDVHFQRKSNSYKNKGDKGIDIFGISPIICSANKYYISFRADMPEIQKSGNSFFEVYDIDGNYLGNKSVDKIVNFFTLCEDNSNFLYFQNLKNDNKIFIAQYRDGIR